MTNFLDKIKQQDQQIGNQLVHEQAIEVAAIIKTVADGKVLLQAPAKLGLLPDQYETIASASREGKRSSLKVMNNLLNSVRQFLSLKYGVWSLPNLTTAALIKCQLKVNSALEIMAGNAYWSLALAQVGLNVKATDSLEWSKTSSTGAQPFYPLLPLGATEAIKKFHGVDLIVCSWAPNFTKSDLEAVAAWRKYSPNSHLLFVGEKWCNQFTGILDQNAIC